MGLFIKWTPKKALFGGVRDLILVPSKGKPASGETPGYLGGRLCTRTGHDTSEDVAENAIRSGKNAKTAKPPVNFCVAVPSENCTTKIAEFRFVAGSGRNRTIISLEITKNIFCKKLCLFIEFDPPKCLPSFRNKCCAGVQLNSCLSGTLLELNG